MFLDPEDFEQEAIPHKYQDLGYETNNAFFVLGSNAILLSGLMVALLVSAVWVFIRRCWYKENHNTGTLTTIIGQLYGICHDVFLEVGLVLYLYHQYHFKSKIDIVSERLSQLLMYAAGFICLQVLTGSVAILCMSTRTLKS